MANEYDYAEWIAYCEWLGLQFDAPETAEAKGATVDRDDLPF